MSANRLIARWQSRGGKYWVELTQCQDGAYCYSTDNGGGCIGMTTLDKAIAHCERQCSYNPVKNMVRS